jgi:hypothetical protein
VSKNYCPMKYYQVLPLLFIILIVPLFLHLQYAPLCERTVDPNEAVCLQKFHLADSLQLQKKPVNEVLIAIAKSFIGTDYAANTLESPGKEQLVVNLQTLDCVTLYENSLVLARCIKKHKTTYDDFKKELQFIRYRRGIMDGYASRLHYTSDYFYDNEKKSVWKNVTKELGGAPFRKTINFMSTHTDLYLQLKNSPENVKAIQLMEDTLNARGKYHIPKSAVKKIASDIQDGDIIGITSTVDGLDCNHTGIALHVNGILHLLHAPIPGSKVQIAALPFWEYLAKIKKDAGIMVVRPLEP